MTEHTPEAIKAAELANAVAKEIGSRVKWRPEDFGPEEGSIGTAFARYIRTVSDVAGAATGDKPGSVSTYAAWGTLRGLILPKPVDPLAASLEVICKDGFGCLSAAELAELQAAALDAAGYEVKRKD